MAVRMGTSGVIAALDALLNTLDSGFLYIRTGAAPTRCEDADTGTLLATLSLNANAFAAATDGTDKATATANAITGESSADATGSTPMHFRAKTSGGTVVIQGTVGTSGTDLIIDTGTINTGDTVNISGSWIVTMSEA